MAVSQAARGRRDPDGANEYDGVCFLRSGDESALWHAVESLRPRRQTHSGRLFLGAAVSVTDGMAHAAIGSDTGGSVRIPAALCGLTGFKPTARRIPLDGALPLSSTLDSAGSLAPTVACCARIDAVLAGLAPQPLQPCSTSKPCVSLCCKAMCWKGSMHLSARPFLPHWRFSRVVERGLKTLPFRRWTRFLLPTKREASQPPEAYTWHRSLLETYGPRYDPRVASRILRGKEMSAADYIDLVQARRQIIADAARTFAGYDAILMPTVPALPRASRISKLRRYGVLRSECGDAA